MKEIWLPILNYEEFYEVSNFGNIKSLRFNRLMKPTKNVVHGYKSVPLNNGKKVTRTYVHRLVAQHFLGISNLTVNHKDGNKTNNRVDNLEWITCSDNHKHAFKLGLKKARDIFGEKNINNKISLKTAKKVKQLLKNTALSQRDISRKLQISYYIVNQIKNNKTWRNI